MIEHKNWTFPYAVNPAFRKKVAYFSMEFAIHQALKIYSGGLGFLAGSHMRSAYELKQNVIGIGILWRHGYYDQTRDDHGYMGVQFQKKFYTFLKQTDVEFTIAIDGEDVKVKTYYLSPEEFGSAPLFLMTTDFPENSDKARAYSNKLYDNYGENRIAQHMLLGIGGAKVVEKLGGADIYHMNEGHALPLCFYLLSQLKNIDAVRNKVVFTTHTPEKAGNEEQQIDFLQRMNFFSNVPLELVRHITNAEGDNLSYTPSALYMSKIANGVSKLHGAVSREMWKQYKGICSITHITNAQNKKFWADKQFDRAFINRDVGEMIVLKKEMKRELFEVVANQTGKIFDPDVLTIVWARRFAGYKRANLIMRNKERFLQMLNNKKHPVQIIWAGKPYPTDHGAVNMFNDLISYTHGRNNCAVLVGYEILLSYLLKRGSDVWLNTPRRPHEASGTSGMTAAMNGSINVSISDGWIPEFAKHGGNSFVTPVADHTKLSVEEIDNYDHENIMNVLENEVIPAYYENGTKWKHIISNSMHDIYPFFDSDRMATEYYQKIYNAEYNPVENLIKSALEGEG
ncbi:MAG: alpha-glucan family phosphorylase [Fimbriimonadaceae bacterium]|nr:alpha-glucan family phosphorylase [Chitinophagales bacterium]